MAVTYLLNGAGGADSTCTPALGNNEKALESRTETTDVTRDIPQATTDEISLAWTTDGAPNNADWPNGDYIGSMEIGAMEAAASIKIQLLRVNSGCAIQETLGTSVPKTGTGVQSYTVNMDPVAGAVGDMFQMRVLGSNSENHKAQTVTVTIDDPDSKMVGPWTPPAGQPFYIRDNYSMPDTVCASQQ